MLLSTKHFVAGNKMITILPALAIWEEVERVIKVDKDKVEVSGMGLILVAELTLAVDEIAKAFGISYKDILTTIDQALDEGIKNDANLS